MSAVAYSPTKDALLSAVPAPATGQPTNSCFIWGWSIRDTSAGANTVELRENTASGKILAVIKLGSGGVETQHAGTPILCNGDVWVKSTGAVDGAVYIG